MDPILLHTLERVKLLLDDRMNHIQARGAVDLEATLRDIVNIVTGGTRESATAQETEAKHLEKQAALRGITKTTPKRRKTDRPDPTEAA